MEGREGGERTLLLEYPNAASPSRTHPDHYAVRTVTHELIQIRDENSGGLLAQAFYDLEADPVQQRPLSLPEGDMEAHRRLQEEMDSIMAEVRSFRLPFVVTQYEMPIDDREAFIRKRADGQEQIVKPLSEEQMEKLRSLGYAD